MTTSVKLPAAQESLDGFLRRLAEAEFWPDVATFLSGFGLQYGRRMVEESEEAEQLLGLESGTLIKISPKASSSEPSRNWRFERHHSAPVCPECLATGEPHHVSWRHAFVTGCVAHGLRLVDQCPMCRETFKPGRGGYDSCHCGCPLDRLERTDAENSEIAISALIAGKMHPARARLAPALAFRTPSDIGDFIFFLASGGVSTITGKHGKTPLPCTIEESRSFLADVCRFLSDWPGAFQEEIARRLHDGDARASSAPAQLGRWYQRLMSFDGDAYANFRQVLAEVVGREFDGAYVGGIQIGAEEREWISAAEAGRILCIRADRVVEAVAQDRVPGRQDTTGFGHRHTMLHRKVVEEISVNRRRFVGKTEVREFLGLSRKQYDLFADAGGVSDCVPDELPPLVNGSYDLEALKKFVEAVGSGAVEPKGSTVEFAQLNLRFTTDKAGIEEVFRRIIQGRLLPVTGSTGGRLGTFRFDCAEVDGVLAEVRRGPGLTAQQVAQLTGWKEQCIAAWCRQGLLAHETFEHSGRTGRMIRVESLLGFQATYLPLSELARQLGTTSRFLIRRLKAVGIDTVGAFQDGDAWRGHLIAQAQVTGVALDISGRTEKLRNTHH